MTITLETQLPTEEELTVQEVPLGTPYLKAGAFHLGKACEVQNNEFMLCRHETKDPRACINEGKAVTSCSLDFFRAIKANCSSEFNAYATCLERSDDFMRFAPCRKTQAAYDTCVKDTMAIERPHFGYFCLPKIHDTDRPKPEAVRPAWLDTDKARKLQELPKDFPRDWAAWGGVGPGAEMGGRY